MHTWARFLCTAFRLDRAPTTSSSYIYRLEALPESSARISTFLVKYAISLRQHIHFLVRQRKYFTGSLPLTIYIHGAIKTIYTHKNANEHSKELLSRRFPRRLRLLALGVLEEHNFASLFAIQQKWICVLAGGVCFRGCVDAYKSVLYLNQTHESTQR